VLGLAEVLGKLSAKENAPCDLGVGGSAGCWRRCWLLATCSLLMGSLGDPSSTLGVDALCT
jgi:hypothetical protein